MINWLDHVASLRMLKAAPVWLTSGKFSTFQAPLTQLNRYDGRYGGKEAIAVIYK
ncbi:hypothetical protein [Bosea sp. CRIB-10]|uniref:hypothetical protein n=1 Tax=Bosea sp. CRIB-10 TaxID=378404 RepID=UPI001587A308|nr:hypothetical protein [Bosea sp. CRIB-10]